MDTDPPPAHRSRLAALDLLGRDPWLIEASAMQQLICIASRLNDSPEAVATRLGRPLDNARTVQTHGRTAVIPIQGPIFRYANLFTEVSGATSLEILARDFQAALDSPTVSRIVLSIDSPGGQSCGIAEFARQIRASTKPVTAYVGDLAASAAYWIASAADEIVASPTAILGSIGVVMTYRPPVERPGEKPTVEIVSSQSPLKRVAPDTPSGRGEAQRLVDQLAEVFVADVAAARRVSQETVLADFGQGGMLIGQYAVAARMADRIASLQSLLMTGAPAGAPPMETYAMSIATPAAAAVLPAPFPTYERAVQQYQAHGMTLGQAHMAAGRAHPDLHRDWLNRVNARPVPAATAPAPDATYERAVQQYQAHGMTLGQAHMAAARAHPDLHRDWLNRVNNRAAA
ncbi:S49 family peptidase [uncultured Lamprocystis sp.]|jgi:ClpP class serine protease|uniref:S49 family peptidase n=6 Tax=uncultured Lamprocystis sp. TaxID=543132 RepID=UPI0025D415A2|nr:S49 family peptidase [uncultured Lamprocystis sp.]